MDLATRLPLNNGTSIPILGFGTWQIPEGPAAEGATLEALRAGYRHIDTAAYYRNERSVGAAVRASGVPREEVFVTTKLLRTDFEDPEGAFAESYERLGVGAIDLYLIHWPMPHMPKSVWQGLEEIYESGRAKAIGVSNYDIRDLEELFTYGKVTPAVNQIEFCAGNADLELLAYCKERSIVVEAYSPLGRGRLTHHPVVQEIAAAYGKTPAQVLIRFALEHGTVPLPKSANPARIRENAQVFDFSLSPADLGRLNTLT